MSEITMYGAPWCGDCRRAKRFFGEHRIAYEWVDLEENQDAQKTVIEMNDGKRIIPTIVFPDGSFLSEPSNDELAEKLGLRLQAEQAFFDVIVIGGGPTGLTAAIYAAREGVDALVIEKSALGGQAGVTERIDNYPGFPEGVGGAELAERIIAQARRYEIELLSAVAVTGIRREGDYLYVDTDQGDVYCAHSVLIATGSSYRRLDVPGEADLIGAGIHFCATCDGPFYRGAEELLVVGGGNSGLEEGIFLSRFADRIRVVEFAKELNASPFLQDKVMRDEQFVVHTNTAVRRFEAEGGKLRAVIAEDLETGEELKFEPAAAFVFIGLDPNTGFLDGIVDLDPQGFIETDERFHTSMDGVFAAGDVRAGSTKQLGAAIGEGTTGLLMIREHLRKLGDVPAHLT